MLNLASKGLTFTAAEFSKYGILQTISKFIAKNQVEVFLARMKTCMFQVKPKLEEAKKLVAWHLFFEKPKDNIKTHDLNHIYFKSFQQFQSETTQQ